METYALASKKERRRIHKYPGSYMHLPDLPIELIKKALVENPNLYMKIPNPSRDVNLFLVRQFGYFLSYVSKEHQDEEICIEAIKEWWHAMRYVEIDFTEEISKACVLSFLKSRMSHDFGHSLQVVLIDIPDKILESASFRRFLIDNGLFEFLGWIK